MDETQATEPHTKKRALSDDDEEQPNIESLP